MDTQNILHATIVLVTRYNQYDQKELLMVQKIHDKNIDVGSGMLVPPGGKLEEGESFIDNAIREVQEETGITPKSLHNNGYLLFINSPQAKGKSFLVKCFYTESYDGIAIQKERRCQPLWVPVDEIPYTDTSKMIPIDEYWLPHMLNEGWFESSFYYDKNESCQISEKVDYESILGDDILIDDL